MMKSIMKNNLKKSALSAIAIMVLLYSCKDSFLEVPPTGTLNQQLLANGTGLEASLLAAYAQVNGRANRMASPSNWVWGSIRGGEANKGTDPGDFSDINPIQRFEALPTQGVISDKWNGNFEGVARCNATLRLIGIVRKEPALTTAQVAQNLHVEAQARFLRAHYYFELVRGFKFVPFVDENIDVTGNNLVAEGIDKVKNDKEIWDKIEADMLFAATNLPEEQSQVGRVNSWAAKAYLAKIYMFQGTVAKITAARDLYREMINPDGSTNAMTSNEKPWGLVPNYADVFKASNDNNEESIWAYQAAANTGNINNANPEFDLNWPYNTGANGPGNCCSFFQPTFEMGNSFRTDPITGWPILGPNGEPNYNIGNEQLVNDMGFETGALWDDVNDKNEPIEYKAGSFSYVSVGNRHMLYKALSDNQLVEPGTNAAVWELIWVEGKRIGDLLEQSVDPRLDHSIGRRGIPYLDWNDFPGKAWIRNQPNAGPYQTKKFVYYKTDRGSLQDNSSWTPGYTAINFPIIRFADVLLMAAEAEIETNGDLNAAHTYINMIRNRAKNPAGRVKDGTTDAARYVIEPYLAVGSQDEMRTRVRFERKLELSGEGHRFYDLVRWSVITPNYARDVINSYLAYESAKLPGAFGGSGDGKGFSSEDAYLPIPQNQIDLLGADILKQNEGY
jgi:hypothetical protein